MSAHFSAINPHHQMISLREGKTSLSPPPSLVTLPPPPQPPYLGSYYRLSPWPLNPGFARFLTLPLWMVSLFSASPLPQFASFPSL